MGFDPAQQNFDTQHEKEGGQPVLPKLYVLTLSSCKSSVWKWGSRTVTASRSISDNVARHTLTTGITRWQNLSKEFIRDKFKCGLW